ncbi:hypothetical protein [Caldithrix abyssi]
MEKIQLTKSQKILFIILGIVLIYAVFDFIKNKETYLSFYAGQETESPVEQQAAQEETDQLLNDPLKIDLTSRWGDDPFLIKKQVKKVTKRSRKMVKEPTFILKGISFRPQGSVALINDRIVKEGDVIEGYKVIKIEEKKVILWDGKKRRILRLTNI